MARDGSEVLYFDWTIYGFSIRKEPKFDVEDSDYIGDFSIKQIMDVWKRHSREYFDLKTNNCMIWSKRVASDLDDIKEEERRREMRAYEKTPKLNFMENLLDGLDDNDKLMALLMMRLRMTQFDD